MLTSIEFPKMFKSSSTNVVYDDSATMQNLCALLGSESGDFKGDPAFGTSVKKYIYEQNDHLLRDIIIDEIYTKITVFMPQLIVKRSDIQLVTNRNGRLATVSANIRVTNRLDFTTNMFNITLFTGEEDN